MTYRPDMPPAEKAAPPQEDTAMSEQITARVAETVARLRNPTYYTHPTAEDGKEAADLLEALAARLAEVIEVGENAQALSKAAYEGLSSLLLSVQQDCIKEHARAEAAEAERDAALAMVAGALREGIRIATETPVEQLPAAVEAAISPDAASALSRLLAEARVAALEEAVEVARRHHSKVQINEPLWHDGQDWASDRIAEAIEALAPASGVADLAALRELLAAIRDQRDKAVGLAEKFEAERDDALTRLAAAEALVGALRDAAMPFLKNAVLADHRAMIRAVDRLRAALAALPAPPGAQGEG
jgi:hypothetical protein